MSDQLDQEQSYEEPAIAGEESDDGETAFIGETRSPVSMASVLLFVLLVAGGAGIYFMHWRAQPKKTANPESVQASATIERFLTDGGRDLRAMQDLLRNTQQVVATFAAFPSQTQVPLSDLKTNPFRIGQLVQPPAEDLEALARKKREEERAAVLKAVGALQLQSIVYGQTRACMINGSLFSEGQRVESFTIERITATTVIVKSGQYRFELRMKR